jgi:superfamily II DNA or RNA helicase
MKSKQTQAIIDYISEQINLGNIDVASTALDSIFTDFGITLDINPKSTSINKRELAQLFCLKGLISENKEEHIEAIAFYSKSAECYKSLTTNIADNKYNISGILYNISVCYRKLNNLEKEEESLLQASFNFTPEKATKLSDFMNHRLAQIYFNLASNYEVQDLIDKSLQYFRVSASFANHVKYEDPSLTALENATKEAKSQIKNYLRAVNGEATYIAKSEKKETNKNHRSASSQEPETRRVENRSLTEAISHLQEYSLNITHGTNPDKLWEHQKNCIINVTEGISQGIKSGYCTMATGTGKTKTFDTIVKTMGTNTVIVVPTTLLIEQTVAILKASSPQLDIGIVDGSRKRKGNNITVTTYQSLKTSLPKGVFKDANLIILDEAHSCLSAERMEVIDCLQNGIKNEVNTSITESNFLPAAQPIIIGFTATEEFNTKRKKGSASAVEELLSHNFFSYNISQGISDQVLSACKIVEIELDEGSRVIQTIKRARRDKGDDTVDITEKDLEALNDKKVNRILPDFIANVRDPETNETFLNKSGLIYTPNIRHAEVISQELNESFGDSNYSRHLHSKMKDKDRQEVLAKHKSGEIKIIVNVDVLTVGYDDPKLEYIIEISPTNSSVKETQRFGRITRRDGENNKPKTYIQLVIAELGQLEAKDLFDGNRRLGIINHPPLLTNPIEANGIEIGEHLYYKTTFSNGYIQERGSKLTKNEEVIYSHKRTKLHHNMQTTIANAAASESTHMIYGASSSSAINTYSSAFIQEDAAIPSYQWSAQEEHLGDFDDVDWEEVINTLDDQTTSRESQQESKWIDRVDKNNNARTSPTSWQERVAAKDENLHKDNEPSI